jgi:hypothetical protein
MSDPYDISWTDEQLKRLQILKELIELEQELGINDYGDVSYGIEEDPED